MRKTTTIYLDQIISIQQLRYDYEGRITPQVETITEENSEEAVDTDDTGIVEDEKKERRRRKKRTARQIRS